ncbi:DNA polymerase IV [Microvirga mediterraneensis]|uniref:DNA polymerase IV n=1 Tax=Microvirga mediterraneensis TaxID=2754695 RepID=A0A838BNP4_9HYPH|nr:DNA polymerase IV [Microvirga mediterraneensis]MBA1157068.1 DNA polymerase IV [Microvirga mediterraneensis]
MVRPVPDPEEAQRQASHAFSEPSALTGQQRKIIHIDMDAFFASVEQRDNPELRGKPVAVGGAGERGVVAAASYEARKFGVRSAMASTMARRQCPDLIFVPPRFDVYREISQQIRTIFAEYTPLIEPLSLDEAYLDVTENLKGITSATQIAEEIRATIREQTALTASAGVSYNKFLAKIASDYRKPDGLFVITPRMGPAFVEALPVGKFHGIGPATTAKMNRLAIHTGLDLRSQSLPFLQEQFGKAGSYYYWISRGVDHRPVQPDRIRKSVGAENTFSSDLIAFEEMKQSLVPIIDKVWRYCEGTGVRGRTVTLKVKYADFQLVTRSRSFATPMDNKAALEHACVELLKPLLPVTKGVRLLGITLSALGAGEDHESPQLTLAL